MPAPRLVNGGSLVVRYAGDREAIDDDIVGFDLEIAVADDRLVAGGAGAGIDAVLGPSIVRVLSTVTSSLGAL
jgi:hypothetical protein